MLKRLPKTFDRWTFLTSALVLSKSAHIAEKWDLQATCTT